MRAFRTEPGPFLIEFQVEKEDGGSATDLDEGSGADFEWLLLAEFGHWNRSISKSGQVCAPLRVFSQLL